jgi:hypothetical protein
MELIHRPGNSLNCLEVRETLSDLIDARRGEIPYPGGTRLAEPGMRSAVELHLAGCADCRDELHAMEEIGLAYSEFSVNEPPAQVFADYPRIIRERLARENSLRAPARGFFSRNKRGIWMTLGASGLAAALAFVVVSKATRSNAKDRIVDGPPVPRIPSIDRHAFKSKVPIRVQHPSLVAGDLQFASQDFTHNPQEPSDLKPIQDQVDQYKYVILAERPENGELPLFGALIKTTREVDQAEDGQGIGGLIVYDVIPGSPAAKMKLQKNDRIVTINDMAVENGGPQEAVDFLTSIRHLGKGAPVTIHVVRPVGSQWMFMKPLTGTLGDNE